MINKALNQIISFPLKWLKYINRGQEAPKTTVLILLTQGRSFWPN